MELTNEFASIEIERDDRGNGPRLRIRDVQTGRCVLLDPLELAALAHARHDDLLPFLDPSRFDLDSAKPAGATGAPPRHTNNGN